MTRYHHPAGKQFRFIKHGCHWLPDIADALIKRLNSPGRMRAEHNRAAIGETIIRQLFDNQRSKLRLSACGSCARQQAFTHHNFVENGHTIDAAARLTFAVGDACEAMLVACLKEAFAGTVADAHRVGEDQAEVCIDVPFGRDGKQVATITGHPDGAIRVPVFRDGEESPTKEWAILEVKSMSDYAFKRFRADGIQEDHQYYYQVQAYMLATGIKRAYMLGFGKSSTAKEAMITEHDWSPLFPLVGQWIYEDKEKQEEIKEKFKTILESGSPFDIGVPYKPNKKGFISFPCDYCSYYKHCFPQSTEVAKTTKWLQTSTKVKVCVGEDND